MTTVFFSGSRGLKELSRAVMQRTDNIVAKGHTILIGDADGADSAMQAYLSRRGYGRVVVFCTGSACRNNVGRWETRRVQPGASPKSGFRYHVVKDQKMSEEATCGFVMWDGTSKGTLRNMISLVELNKKVLVYFAPSDTLHEMSSREELAALVASAGGATLEELEKELRVKMGARTREKQLTFA